MFPDLEFIKTCLNGLRSQIEKVENWVVSFVRTNRSNWAQNDPNALDYVKGRTHYEVNGRVVQLPSKFLPSPTSNTVGAIKADSAKTTDIQPVRLGTDGKLYSSGVPIFTTSGTESAYTANVPEINELVNGMLVVMIPHETSGLTAPTLNINGLGAHQIRRFRSNLSGSYESGVELSVNTPVLLMYNSGRWFACNFTKPDVQDLFGTVSISHGGTGASFLTKGSYLVGNGTRQVLQKTPSEVLADIGAIPVPATAKVGQVIAVKAVDADGKPTAWEAVDTSSGDSMRWQKIKEITLTEQTNSIVIGEDDNGVSVADYNPIAMKVEFHVPADSTQTNDNGRPWIYPSATCANNDIRAIGSIAAWKTVTRRQIEFFTGDIDGIFAGGNANEQQLVPNPSNKPNITVMDGVKLYINSTGDHWPVGTIVSLEVLSGRA